MLAEARVDINDNRRTGVDISLLHVASVPLSNTRATGVSEDNTSDVFESSDLTVPLNGSTNLLGTGGDGEFALDVKTVRGGFLGNRGGAGHVFVRRVGARTDQTDFELLRPVVRLDGGGKLRDRGGKIGCEGTVDMWLQFREVLKEELSKCELSRKVLW